MTIDKAIETLTELRGYPKPGFNGEDALAITLGIEALKLIGQHPTIRFFLANKLLPGEAEE